MSKYTIILYIFTEPKKNKNPNINGGGLTTWASVGR